MFLHLIQPYPFLHSEFIIVVLGQEITYTLNLLLYFLCTFRVYVLFKVIRYWNLYSSNRSRKILKFFSPDSNPILFLYRANLDRRGFITLTLLGFCTLLASSLLLKAMEYTQDDKSNPFYYYWNSIWYLIVTMCTIGFNDITPRTVLGRFLGVIMCLVGVVILSLLVVTLTFFTDLDSEELAAYNNINNLSRDYNQKSETKEYVDNLVRYKIKEKMKKVDMDCIIDKINRNRKKTQIVMHLKRHLATKGIFDEFITKVRDITDTKLGMLTTGFDGMWGIEDNLDDYFDTNDDLVNIARTSKTTMISCLNLANSLVNVGSISELDDVSNIQGKKLISETLMLKAKKFYLESKDDDAYLSSSLSDHTVSPINNSHSSRNSLSSSSSYSPSEMESNSEV